MSDLLPMFCTFCRLKLEHILFCENGNASWATGINDHDSLNGQRKQ